MTKRIAAMFIGVIFGSLGAESEAQMMIQQAEQASQFGLFDAQVLIRSLTDSNKKPTQEISVKACRNGTVNQGTGRCGMTLKSPKEEQHLAQLFIFVSASMPQQSIKALGQQAQKIGAHLVFRGLVGENFSKMQSYMKELGIAAEIDPPKFDDYTVTIVPTFILTRNNVSDRISGHVSLFEALDQFRKKGELKSESQKLYQSLKNKRGES
jgi:type-F conjugative transfer system pilin assembly protein TrbC